MLFFNNIARPNAIFVLWMACLGKLYTRDRLKRFGVTNDDRCFMCDEFESVKHMFFGCRAVRDIWEGVLNWLRIDHIPRTWDTETGWILQKIKGKNPSGRLLQGALAETIYAVWKMRNKKKTPWDATGGDTSWEEV